MTDSSDADFRHASDRRFARDRHALVASLRGLLGPRGAPEPLADADRAAALAAEARAAHREAADLPWALVRHLWTTADRAGVTAVLHGVSGSLGSRACWLIVPGREPQAVPLASDAALDNPLGFAALAAAPELVLLDQQLPAGLSLVRHDGEPPGPAHERWELEVWGAEPWLSAATRAIREWRARPTQG